MLIYQTKFDNLDTISSAQFTLIHLHWMIVNSLVGLVLLFLKNGGKNWFHDNLKLEAVRDYFKLDLQIQANNVKFADHDRFGDEWKSAQNNHNNDILSWIIFYNLLNFCSNMQYRTQYISLMLSKITTENLHFVVSVLLLWLRIIKACWLWGQWFMIQSSMESMRLQRLQELLCTKSGMTIGDNLTDHCFSTAANYVRDREAANIDVLKYFQSTSKTIW